MSISQGARQRAKLLQRAAIVPNNLSNPVRPEASHKPAPNGAKRSATVRTYDNPAELGNKAARFADPDGNLHKGRDLPGKIVKGRYVPPVESPSKRDSYRWSDQPDGDAYLVDARHRDAKRIWLDVSEMYLSKRYPVESPLNPASDSTPSPVYTVPKATIAPYVVPEIQRPFNPAVQVIGRPQTAMVSLSLASVGETHAPAKGTPVKSVRIFVETVLFPNLKDDGGAIVRHTLWTPKVRKALFNRLPVQSRQGKTIRLPGTLPYRQSFKGFRLVPRNPDTLVRLVLAG